MKTTITYFLLCLMLSFSAQSQIKENTLTDYPIIPKPVELQIKSGQFCPGDATQISGPAELKNEGEYLAKLLAGTTGKNIGFTTAGDGAGIVLRLDPAIKHEEGYELNVSENKITISGKNPTGVFYGIQTLKQLVAANADASGFTVPAVEIKDHPRFGYRGMHLDVARHYFPVSYIKEFIDLIAMHKMNTFHWHLTEDQGWRIEIKKYPKLTEVGAYRNGTIVGRYPGKKNDETRYGGFYTQEEVKDIVAYAADRHITVIPEIELPGHAGAAIAAYPQLSCFPEEPTVVANDMMSQKSRELQQSGTPKIVQETWGVMDDVFCAGKEETFAFLQDVLDEVIPLFPAKYVHIGGDECPKGNWKRCPNCQARIKKEGLKDEYHLQSYFVQRMEKYLNSKGKSIIGWDEILEGGLAPNATVMSWRGIKGGIEAAKQNHDVIMTPTGFCYFDYYQVGKDDQKNEPLAIGGYLPVKKVYSYNPVPEALPEHQHKHILGAQGNVWTEYIKTPEQVVYMSIPRMTALSEVVWSPQESRDWEDFKIRLQRISKIYDKMGLNYAKHALQP